MKKTVLSKNMWDKFDPFLYTHVLSVVMISGRFTCDTTLTAIVI